MFSNLSWYTDAILSAIALCVLCECFKEKGLIVIYFLFRNVVPLGHTPECSNTIKVEEEYHRVGLYCFVKQLNLLNGPLSRAMSTSKGRSMRSKVERRMQKESGKTLREIRRAKKLKKKLMTEEERLIYNLKRVCSPTVLPLIVFWSSICEPCFQFNCFFVV